MGRPLFYFLAIAGLFSVSGYSSELNHEPSKANRSCGNGPMPARIAIRHIEPNGVGYNQGYSTLEAFFSSYEPLKNQWVPFVDLRGHVFNNARLAANAGVGLRYLSSYRVWGVNTYYDFRNTSHLSYQQIALGLESLGKKWDFRLNGYFPLGRTKSAYYNLRFDDFETHYLVQSRKREFAMTGANAEVGIHTQSFKHIPLYLAMGPYYLTGEKTTWGTEARLSIDCGNYLRIEGSASYDHLFKWIGQGQLSLTLPLGRKREIQPKGNHSCSAALTLNERLVQRVDRNEIIPVDHKRSRAFAIDPSTGLPYFFVFVDNTSHSAGTFESPYNTLADAQANSSPGNVIYVFEGDGIYTIDNTIAGTQLGFEMQDSQHLWGSGIAQSLQTTWGKTIVPPLTSGFPVVTSAPFSSAQTQIVTLANNCEVSGINLAYTTTANGTNLYGIYDPPGFVNAQIRNNQIDLSVSNNFSNNVAGVFIENNLGTFDFSKNNVTINQSGTLNNLWAIMAAAKAQNLSTQYYLNQNQAVITNSGTISDIYVIDIEPSATYNLNLQIVLDRNKVIVTNSSSGTIGDLEGILVDENFIQGVENLQFNFNQNEENLSNSGTISGLYGFDIIGPISGINVGQFSFNQNKVSISNSGDVSSADLYGMFLETVISANNGRFIFNQNEVNFFQTGNVTGGSIYGIYTNFSDGNNSSFLSFNQNKTIISNSGTISSNIFGVYTICNNSSIGNSQIIINRNNAIINPGVVGGFVSGIYVSQSQAGMVSLNLTNNFSNSPIQLINGNLGGLTFFVNSYGNQPLPTGP